MNRLLSLLALVALTSTAYAQLETVRFGAEPAGSVQNAPALATTGPETIYLAWSDYRAGAAGEIYLTRSTDGGTTFDTPRPIISTGSVMGAMRRGVAMVADNRGRLHLAWINSANSRLDLVYSRSTDGGTTFSTPRSIAGTSGITADVAVDFPSIAADSNDGVYVVWIDNRDAMTGGSSYTQLYSTRSLDGGANWEMPLQASRYDVPGGSCECCNTALATTPEGTVAAVYRSNIDNRRDVFLARSRDRGASFENALPVASEEWIIPACPMTGPAIALDRNGVAHVVWRDGRTSVKGKPPIFYTTVGPESRSAALDRSISLTTKASNFPAIVITPQGAIVVPFEDNSIDPSDVMSVTSTNGGDFSTIPFTLSNDGSASTKQDLVAAATLPDGARVFAWHDEGNNANDIVLAVDRSPILLTLPDSVPLASPLGGTVPAGAVVLKWNAPASPTADRSLLYDVAIETPSGWRHHLVNGVRSVDDTLGAGTYRWTARALSSVGSSRAADTVTFTVSSVGEVRETTTLRLASNTLRAGENVEIDLDGNRRGTTLRMIDLAGRVVRALDIAAGVRHAALGTAGLPAGTYQIESGEQASGVVIVY